MQYRKNIRLRGYDYSTDGMYFVTICTRFRGGVLSNIIPNDEGVEHHLTEVGKIIHEYWLNIPNHFSFASVGDHVIMPDHMHGILILNGRDVVLQRPNGDQLNTYSDVVVQRPYEDKMSRISPHYDSLSNVIRSFKSACTHTIRNSGHPSFSWQPRFYDKIIRSDKAYDAIREYIHLNPIRWKDTNKDVDSLWY